MSKRDPNSLLDGITYIERGVNSGLAAISLGRDQLASGVNITTRGRFIRNRPGFNKQTLRFLASDGSVDAALQSNFEDGIFQGAISFDRRNRLVVMIGGRLFSINLLNNTVLDVTSPLPDGTPDPNPANRYRGWLAVAEDWVIAQDGQSAPWIFDGALTTRSDTFGVTGKKQVPTGEAMVFSNGRLCSSLIGSRSFVVGDISGGDSGTLPWGFRDSVIHFTENDVYNGGGAFTVPIDAGPLTAFRPVAQMDTSMGQGPSQVFTTGGCFSLNTPTDRSTWATVNYPLGTVSLVDSGSVSDRATVNVNGDIWFRAPDGVRSFVVARRNFTSWVNAPLSQEVERYLSSDDKSLFSYASAAVFDNRMLMTCNPYREWGHGIVHRGLVVLDFAPLAFLSTSVPPVWEGLWTGLRVLQVLSGSPGGIQRCFVFALSASNTIELWELTKAQRYDFDGSTQSPIEWSFETSSLNFPRRATPSPVIPSGDLQRLANGQLFIDSIEGTVSFDAYYRADQEPDWHDWHSWAVCAQVETCSKTDDCNAPPTLQTQFRRPFRLPIPNIVCDSINDKPSNVGAEFQGRLQVTGSCRIKRWEFIAYDEQEDVTNVCAPTEACAAADVCPINDFGYTIA